MADSAESEVHTRTQQSPLASQRAKEQGQSTSRGSWLPMSYKEGFSQWWASISPAAAENKVLSFVPYLQAPPTQTQTGNKAITADPSNDSNSTDDVTTSTTLSRTTSPADNSPDPHGPRRWHSSLVKLAGKDRAINEFSVERVGERVDNNLVILHGYGAGLGFFYKNFEPLSRAPRWRLYALDLLGMGRSSRPHFRIHAKDRAGKIAEAEAWFVESLEEWRRERQIEKFTLLGHSLGGYMAVCYALKYPGRLNKLILASPVGVPEDPYAVNEELPDPTDGSINAEFADDQHKTAADGGQISRRTEPAEPRRRPLPKWLTYLWDANVSPFSIVRWTGPLGPRLVSGWTSRRFSKMPPEEAQALHDYAYSLFRQRGSGEYALAYILAPGAFARSPLIRRIGGVGRQWMPREGERSAGSDSTKTKENGLPVVLMYGENDWMDVAGGYAAADKLREAKQKAIEGLTKEERDSDNGKAKVYIVKGAGHHVYLDGWDEFNQIIKDEMNDVELRQRKASS